MRTRRQRRTYWVRALALCLSLPMGLSMAGAGRPAALVLSSADVAAVERGDVVVVAARDTTGADTPATSAHAAIRISASPERVFAVMTDCALAPAWVPRLVSCQVLESDPARATEVIAHQVDYGWFAPRIQYSFRTHYENRRRIRFEHVGGDLLENEGAWELALAADGVATIVTYRVRTRPRFAVPQRLYQLGVSREIPALLRALRARAER
jgi:uncharacterized membrane protein